jgi:hypothetical protein
MHEVSLQQTINDYITGEEIELSTYEDIRQALAKILVEEKGYPKENIFPKVELNLDINQKPFTVSLDFIIKDQGKPVLLLAFCAGEVSSYVRQYISAARLFDPPIPLVVVTDSKDARLVRTSDKKIVAQGFNSIPRWNELRQLLSEIPEPTLTPEKKQKEARLAYAFFSLTDGCCTSCSSKPTGQS